MIAFSCVLAFTDLRQNDQFYLHLQFAILPVMTLGQVMCFEGNYLDGLMSRKESIYNLLRAKYYLNCLILLIPSSS